MAKRANNAGSRSSYDKRLMRQDEIVQREAAFAAIRRLYCEVLPLWRTCPRGCCRRHRCCAGEPARCLPRGWPLMPEALQARAYAAVIAGGPRRRPAATPLESQLRSYPPTNFVL